MFTVITVKTFREERRQEGRGDRDNCGHLQERKGDERGVVIVVTVKYL